jgi:hypothetical protein
LFHLRRRSEESGAWVACCLVKDIVSAGIQKFVECWNRWIEEHGGCIEKWYNCKVSAVVEINYKNCVRIFIDLPSYIVRMKYCDYRNHNFDFNAVFFSRIT